MIKISQRESAMRRLTHFSRRKLSWHGSRQSNKSSALCCLRFGLGPDQSPSRNVAGGQKASYRESRFTGLGPRGGFLSVNWPTLGRTVGSLDGWLRQKKDLNGIRDC